MKLQDLSKRLSSSLDARILIKHITGLSDSDLIGMTDIALSPEQKGRLDDYVAQRIKGRPISKIIGYKEFYGRVFRVTDDVLDPRPDSETLIDVVLNHIKDRTASYTILDLGTGSGCLALTLLAELPQATALCADISTKALDIAKDNAESLGVQNRITFKQSDWFSAITGTYDIIVTNPPYIETTVIDTLDTAVRDYDPILALDGGKDGLAPYRQLCPQIRTFLNKGGIVAMEHGAGQSLAVKRLIENAGFHDIDIHHDLGKHDRCVSARL